MPIGANAVANSLPKAHHEPREGGDGESDEIPFPGSLPCPAETIEHDEQRVKDQEEDIQKLESGGAHWSMFTNLRQIEFPRDCLVRSIMHDIFWNRVNMWYADR